MKVKLSFLNIIKLIIGVSILAVFYFVYNQQQNKVTIYATGVMGSSGDLFLAVPYWVANSINIGDRDISPSGTVNVEILDKESYEGGSHGKHVILKMKLNLHRDRNGKYYYRNQQLKVNVWVELTLGDVSEKVYITYLNTKQANYPKQKLRITVKKNSEEMYIADNLSINDEMRNDKGEVLVKIINKTTSPAIIKSYSDKGELTLFKDPARRDIELTIDIIATRKEGLDYFEELRKIRVNEKINLFFNYVTLWDGIITSVKELDGQ